MNNLKRLFIIILVALTAGLVLAKAEDYSKHVADGYGIAQILRNAILYSTVLFFASILYDFNKLIANDENPPLKHVLLFCLFILASVGVALLSEKLALLRNLFLFYSIPSEIDVSFGKHLWLEFLACAFISILFGLAIFGRLHAEAPLYDRETASPHAQRIAANVLLFALAIVPTITVFFKGAGEAAAVALPLIAAVAFANFDRILKFKGGGIEVETRDFAQISREITDSTTSDQRKDMLRRRQIVSDNKYYTLYANGILVERLTLQIPAHKSEIDIIFPLTFPIECLSVQGIDVQVMAVRNLGPNGCQIVVLASPMIRSAKLILTGL